MAARSSNRSRSQSRARPKRPRPAALLPPSRRSTEFDAAKVAEHIEGCRAHAENLAKMARISSHALFEYYDYDDDDPELWQCCRLVYQVLQQTQTALATLGAKTQEAEPHSHAQEIAMACDVERVSVRSTVHVMRATIHVLLDLKADFHDEVLPSLRVLEGGLSELVTELQCVIQHSPRRPVRQAPRPKKSARR